MLDLKEVRADWNKEVIRVVNSNITGDQFNAALASYAEILIRQAKYEYYKGTPIMDDKSYDWLEDNLRSLNPNSSILESVGG